MALRTALPSRLLLVVGLTLTASDARTQQPAGESDPTSSVLLAGMPERVALRWRAAEGCPGPDAFVDQVAGRTPRARWVAASPGLRVFEVSIHPGRGGLVGELRIQGAGAASSLRTVEAMSCTDVVAALALVAALAIDPKADLSAAVPASGRESPSVPADSVPPLPDEAPASSSVEPAGLPLRSANAAIEPPIPLPSAPFGREQDAEPSPSPPVEWRWALGVQAFATSGFDAVALRAGIFGDVARFANDLWSPSVRLGLSFEPPRSLAVDGGSADFWKAAVQPSVCPLGLEPTEALWLRPCLGVELGLLHGQGNLYPERSASAPWLAAVIAARVEYDVLEWLLVEVQAELGIPLIRSRFYFEPDRTIADVAAVYGTVGGGAGVRFP